jgi:hypothetical protein
VTDALFLQPGLPTADRISKEKIIYGVKKLLEKAKMYEDQKRWGEAERCYSILVEILDDTERSPLEEPQLIVVK